jgi:hypothetical protein
MEESLRLADYFILYGTAQATASNGGLGHTLLRSTIERWRIYLSMQTAGAVGGPFAGKRRDDCLHPGSR